MTFYKRFLSRFSKDIGIDLGTANTVVYVRGEGIVLREPSVVAMNTHTKEVLAIGEEAYRMVGRTPGNLVAVRPLKDGVIANFDITESMVHAFIKKAVRHYRFSKPRILIGVPWGITDVEKRAVLDAALKAGAGETLLIDEPMAAAVGAHIDVCAAEGSMVIDIGGGTTEVAVISLGGIVVCKSSRVAGDEFDESIITHCRKNYNLLIGERMAERIKINIGSAYPFEEDKTMEVSGRDLLSGLPKTFTMSSYEIRDALSDPVSTIIQSVRLALEKTPPELSSDIMQKGIYMTGGGSLLHGLVENIMGETEIPIKRADDPLSCVAIGTGKILESNMIENVSGTISRRF